MYSKSWRPTQVKGHSTKYVQLFLKVSKRTQTMAFIAFLYFRVSTSRETKQLESDSLYLITYMTNKADPDSDWLDKLLPSSGQNHFIDNSSEYYSTLFLSLF